MKLSLALVTVLATFAVALPQNKAGQGNQAAAAKQQGQAKGGQGQAKAQGNNGAAAAGAAAAADSDVNAKANNGADVSLLSFLIFINCKFGFPNAETNSLFRVSPPPLRLTLLYCSLRMAMVSLNAPTPDI